MHSFSHIHGFHKKNGNNVQTNPQINLEMLKTEIKNDTIVLPSIDYLTDTGVNNDVENMSITENHLNIIKTILSDYNIEVNKISSNIMPIYSQIIVEIKKTEQIDDVLKLQNIFSEKIKDGKFIIVNRNKEFTFEITNEHMSRVCLKTLLRKQKGKEKLPVGIDIEKDTISLNLEDDHTVFVVGKHGSGTTMILNTLIMGFAYTNEPQKSEIMLLDGNKHENSLHVLFKDLPHIHNKNNINSEKYVELFTKIVEEGVKKKTLIIFNNFEEFLKGSFENRKLLISLIKYANTTKKLYVVIASNVIDNDSAGTDIYSLICDKFILKTNTANESISLLNSNRAFELYGFGDCYYIHNEEKKQRMQSIYLGKEEVNTIIEIINTFYSIKESNN
jgi:DNA segregation ATPase FtsK/SpoIIIE-like protein